MRYYLDVAGRAFGPFPLEKIRDMIASGKVERSTKLSTDKMEWKTAEEFQELFPRESNLEPAVELITDDPVWYVSVDGKTTYGPYSATEITTALNNGRLSGDAYVWREGERARPLRTEPTFQGPTVADPSSSDPRVWYYSVDGKVGYGPFSVSEIRDLASNDRNILDAVVWRQGENSRRMRAEPAFASLFGQASQTPGVFPPNNAYAAPPTPPSGYGRDLSSPPPTTFSNEGKDLNQKMSVFRGLALAFSILAFVIVCFAPRVAQYKSSELKKANAAYKALEELYEDGSIFATEDALKKGREVVREVEKLREKRFLKYACILVPAHLATLAFYAAFLYYFGRSIPNGFSKRKPDFAWFLIVPGFCLYAVFPLLNEGTSAINSALSRYASFGAQRGARPKYASPGVATALAILFVAQIVLIFPPLFFILTIGMKNAAAQLNIWRLAETKVPQSRVTLDEIVNS